MKQGGGKMIEKDDGVIYEFVFISLSSEGMKHRVYSTDKNMIDLFAKQHGFDVNNIQVNILPRYCMDDNAINDDCFLKIFQFKSNSSDQIYHVASSDQILRRIIDNVAQDLTNTLTFGPLILRNDVEFINLITELVSTLSCGYIMDFLIVDDNWTEENRWKFIENSREGFADSYYEGIINFSESERVFDILHDKSIESLPQPITIEAYVRNFTELLIDKYIE